MHPSLGMLAGLDVTAAGAASQQVGEGSLGCILDDLLALPQQSQQGADVSKSRRMSHATAAASVAAGAGSGNSGAVKREHYCSEQGSDMHHAEGEVGCSSAGTLLRCISTSNKDGTAGGPGGCGGETQSADDSADCKGPDGDSYMISSLARSRGALASIPGVDSLDGITDDLSGDGDLMSDVMTGGLGSFLEAGHGMDALGGEGLAGRTFASSLTGGLGFTSGRLDEASKRRLLEAAKETLRRSKAAANRSSMSPSEKRRERNRVAQRR